MPHYQATVRSARSAPETFDYLATFSNAAHWDPDVTAGEQLDPGPVRAGTRFHPLVRLVGRSIPLAYAVTSYDPPRAVVLTAANALLRSVDQITITPLARALRSATKPTYACAGRSACSTR
jgi:Polyketide cyclase / dehydrase and lipid transport